MVSMSEVHVKVVPELSEEARALLGSATEDTLGEVNAGAALVYAIYHTPKADVVGFFDAMPEAVIKAYMKACEAYGVGSNKATGRYKWVEVAGQADAVKVIDADPTAP